ncbi:type II toxin-antitoxin system RelE/ParE family toxin [Arthrobacter sp. NIO-1057]|uniref:type II toxin-antitoxin system RelE/ParE family toxin n=1 Tax=Arthrobacter sp. NIO-1057 TaxID=993071 RepID=UPI001E34A208|nr:type II toxin-antitoxin system RelE/ParE family toxin [Arthrobacter sp. NIO-1057]
MQRATLRKLELIHAAKDIEDLRIPPGNRLEQLAGDRHGQHSIRVNAQWRLCFVWRDGDAEDVELVDYH